MEVVNCNCAPHLLIFISRFSSFYFERIVDSFLEHYV